MPSRYPRRAELDVVIVGNVCRDIAPDDPRGWRLGGGVAYTALTCARLGLRPAAVVGADRIAAGAAELELLRAAGVAVRIVPLAQGPVFDNLETPGGRVQTCLEPGDPLPVVALPRSWAEVPCWLVVPVAGETGPGWAGAVPPAAQLVLGWQGLLRSLAAGERTARRPPCATPLLTRADVVGVSRHDLADSTPIKALIALLRPGALLVLTDGAAGGDLVIAGDAGPRGALRYRALATRQFDSTGAGDVFLAALVAAGIMRGVLPGDRQPSAADVSWAAAASSLVVEGPGLPAVPDRAEVLARLEREPGGPLLSPPLADLIDG